jgi:hypothetical protein
MFDVKAIYLSATEFRATCSGMGPRFRRPTLVLRLGPAGRDISREGGGGGTETNGGFLCETIAASEAWKILMSDPTLGIFKEKKGMSMCLSVHLTFKKARGKIGDLILNVSASK